mmetsp:Transcript_85936/g.199793  ORF Transcript_85936/g.199793 Transcript_85936/m.199793 type:complete len:323 (-) Transcript_85936:66-1034(-)
MVGASGARVHVKNTFIDVGGPFTGEGMCDMALTRQLSEPVPATLWRERIAAQVSMGPRPSPVASMPSSAPLGSLAQAPPIESEGSEAASDAGSDELEGGCWDRLTTADPWEPWTVPPLGQDQQLPPATAEGRELALCRPAGDTNTGLAGSATAQPLLSCEKPPLQSAQAFMTTQQGCYAPAQLCDEPADSFPAAGVPGPPTAMPQDYRMNSQSSAASTGWFNESPWPRASQDALRHVPDAKSAGAPRGRRRRAGGSLIDQAKRRAAEAQQQQQPVVGRGMSQGSLADVGGASAICRFCPFCGGSVQAHFRFCQFCGSSIIFQ